MALTPYTRVYDATDASFTDEDAVLAEFTRIEEFLAAWRASFESIGAQTVYSVIEEEGLATDDVQIDPANGLIQSLEVGASVSTFDVNFASRADGNTYRVYLVLRCRSKDTRFTVSGPGGHVFGINRSTYSPSQALADGFYSAVVIATYGTNGVFLSVHAHNDEETDFDGDDVLVTRQL